MELILKHWKDALLVFSQSLPDAASKLSSSRYWSSICVKEWLLMVMLRCVAMHNVLRYMIACLDANYQDARFSRETPEGQQRFQKLQQCHLTLKNVANTPSIELLSLLTTYGPILSDLAALHSESRPDSINHPALALLHRDVSELLTDALDATTKSAAQPSTLQLELQAVIRRKLRSRSSMSSSATVSSPAAATPGTGSGSKSGAEAAAAAASPSVAEHDGGARSISSPPPHSATPATNSGIREDSPEMASACLRSAACAACSCRALIRDTICRFLALDRPYGGVIDWCAALGTVVHHQAELFSSSQVSVHRSRAPHRLVVAEVEGNAAEQSSLRESRRLCVASCCYCSVFVCVLVWLKFLICFYYFCVLTVILLQHRGASALSAQAKTTLMCVLLPKF
jgi:hypothetical protein